MTTLRIATRASALALSQARWVGDRLADVGVGTEIVEVTTTGDLDRMSPVTTLTEVGAFVRAVQRAVLDGRADLAVHSCKDLPVAGPAELTCVFPERAGAADVLCGAALASLPHGARVGTGSPRRTAQLRRLRPDLRVEGIRGNVDTRLGKVASGEFDAVVLAEAGLVRSGLDAAIDYRFSVSEMVPAPAQGALAVEFVAESTVAQTVTALDHAPTRRAVEAERSLLARTGAGCRAALGAYASVGATTTMHGFVEDDDGARWAVVHHDDPVGASLALQAELAL